MLSWTSIPQVFLLFSEFPLFWKKMHPPFSYIFFGCHLTSLDGDVLVVFIAGFSAFLLYLFYFPCCRKHTINTAILTCPTLHKTSL